MAANKEFCMYKGKPLVRSGNTIYYGDPNEKYIAVFYITETKTFEDREIPSKVVAELQLSDRSLRPRARILKHSEKDGFFKALDIGFIWLERALASEQ
ncbi:MAG: hypothetical protein E7491_02665 [Ruminococcaceae bacterium]|nr:hypothetical protein [Oscillospiraceae bacterium]